MSENLPSTKLFSRKELEKQAVDQTGQSWMTLGPLVGAGGILLLGGIGLELALIPVATASLALGAVGLGHFWHGAYGPGKDKRMRDFVIKRREWLNQETDRRAGAVRRQLEQIGEEQGIRQLDELQNSFRDFLELINRRFSDHGLSKGRFLGTVEQVRAGAITCLGAVCDYHLAIESIPDDLEHRVPDNETKAMRDNRLERVRHRKEAVETIQMLYHKVEEAVTHISKISMEVASMEISDTSDRQEMLLVELAELAEQTAHFKRET